jgi:hypothetical protein
MPRSSLLVAFVVFTAVTSVAATPPAGAEVQPRPRSERYRALQRELGRGWNTWNTNSVVSHVRLPDGVAVSLGVRAYWKEGRSGGYLAEARRGYASRPEKVQLGPRTTDGRYTSLELEYMGTTLTVESGTDGDDVLLLVRPKEGTDPGRASLVVDLSVLWNRPGLVGIDGDRLVANVPSGPVTVGTTAAHVPDRHVPLRTPHFVVSLAGPVGIFTGRPRTVAEIEGVLAAARREHEEELGRWKELTEPFAAMQSVLAWNAVYDPENDRVIAPVSRTWSVNFGGYVLFDWDTYFAAVMFSAFDRKLAYANAVEITKSITKSGFVPNYASAYGQASFDRSQPPVGSRVIAEIYKKYRERWLLEEVYDDLLAWNRWWPRARRVGDHLVWGTDELPATPADAAKALGRGKLESGLDNSPLFDDVPLKPGTGLMLQADVGLEALYVMDCDALAEIARVLGKTADARELSTRANTFRKALAGLWNEERGIYLDRRLDNGKPSPRLAPTHFYPLLARAATQKQAERMIKEHYFNPAEFHGRFVMPSIARNDPAFADNHYWRGRIWAPMNYLVYLGLRNYDLPAARKDLVERSRALLLESWRASRSIYENYNATTGEGGDVKSAENFYHWGALLGFIGLIESGHLPRPEAPLPR